MDDQAYYTENCQKIQKTRAMTRDGLHKLGFFVTDSRSNFVLAIHPKLGGGTLYRRLKERGILVRHFPDTRIRGGVRITIGSPEQMDALLAATETILQEEGAR
jgi:histidinol-phosphate aminotransferase